LLVATPQGNPSLHRTPLLKINKTAALELCETLTVLPSIGENSDLVVFYKELMILEGHSAYRHQIYRDDQLSPSQHQFLHSKEQLLRNCWANWNGK